MDDDNPPAYLSGYYSPHIDGNMADAVGSDHQNFLGSSEFLLDGVQDADYADFIPRKSPPDALTPDATSATISPSSSDSQSNSIGASDSSSGDASTASQLQGPGRIPIPADNGDDQDLSHAGHIHLKEEPCIGNDLFDFDSAASSPSKISLQPPSLGLKMPIRSGMNNGAVNFGFTPRQASSNTFSTGPAYPYPPQHGRHPSDFQTQYVNGDFLHNPMNEGLTALSSPATINTHRTHIQGEVSPMCPTLHASPLPKTQRVETQMHVRLTLWPLPPGVTKLHFQTHTMARTKLVMKPPPQKSPHMLELHAHCVCATAMEQPEKRRQALERAAKDARGDESNAAEASSSPRNLQMADNDPNKPLNGGFVFICDQCIRRENKRLGRKKLKNEDEEESWLEEQPKRIIVFNKAEVMDWQNWSSYKDEDGMDDAAFGLVTGQAHFPDHAMQLRFPMRIQCYSRHHGEKLGYRVIYTISDWQNNVVAQTMTTASIITDDHKAQHSAKLSSDISATGFSGDSDIVSLGGLPPVHPTYYGFPLSNRNSFSSPDLQSLQLSHHQIRPQQLQHMSTNSGDSQPSGGLPPSRGASRPASPSTPFGPQSKRRKGSGNGINRIRSDLMMTRITPSTPTSPFSPERHTPGSSFLNEQQLQQQMSPSFDVSHGLPNATNYYNSHPPTPSNSSQQYHQRSQSIEDLQISQQPSSIPTSAWQSRVPSADSSPQPLPQAGVPGQTTMPASANARSYEAPVQRQPLIRKVTPAEGPTTGGIEVTCLGEGFVSSSKALFGNVMATTVTVWGDGALVCLLPPAARPGLVNITIHGSNAPTTNAAHQNRVPFKYVDNGEESLMRQTLLLLNQQFRGGSFEASEFTQKMLHSLRTSLKPDSNVAAFGQAQSGTHSKSYAQQELENTVLGALEIIDLDMKPKQADLNTRGVGGQTMLHLAAFLDLYRLSAALLARGANVDARDSNGMTPMHMAALQGNTLIIRKLRSAGSDPTIRSLDGIRADDLTDISNIWRAIDDLSLAGPSASKKPVQLVRGEHKDDVDPSEHLKDSGNKPSPFSASRSLEVDPLESGSDKACIPDRAGDFSSWHRYKLFSLLHDSRDAKAGPKAQIGADAAALAASPALSAWRDQILGQVHQLQQSLQRVLPLVPTMPDYQAHSVMRRISSLVPQRVSRQVASPDAEDMANVEYHWWELITGSAPAPPAYEDIYPIEDKATSSTTHATHSPPSAMFDNLKPAEADGQLSETLIIDTLNISREGWTKQQQEQIREAHARKVKRLRSDRNLFFFWIPLLLLIIFAMIKEGAADVMYYGSKAKAFLGKVLGEVQRVG